jgi:uncharacterized protein
VGETGGRVRSLHRYPVKSLLGEDLDVLDVDERGVTGDRLWSVRTPDNKIGSGKTTRRFEAIPGLLMLRARTVDGQVEITLPDGGTRLAHDPEADRALTDQLGRPVTLARESDVSHFDDGPVSVLAVESVAAVCRDRRGCMDASRFRSNIVLCGLPPFGEDAWVGRLISVGEVRLEVTMRSVRCVMIDMQTADLPAQPGNLRAVGQANDACLGVVARVVRPGRVRVGDHVRAL